MNYFKIGFALIGIIFALLIFIVLHFSPFFKEFPELIGHCQVGSTSLCWTDKSRQDFDVNKKEHNRYIPVKIFYPTEKTKNGKAKKTLYMDDKIDLMKTELYRRFQIPYFVSDSMLTFYSSGIKNLNLFSIKPRFPIIIFSPAFAFVKENYTALLENIASFGYIVFSIEHPYISGFTLDDKGNASSVRSDKKNKEVEQWQMKTIVDDFCFVFDQIRGLNADIVSPFYKRCDMKKVVLIGHKIGGCAALKYASLESNVKAIVDIDGFSSRQSQLYISKPTLFLLPRIISNNFRKYLLQNCSNNNCFISLFNCMTSIGFTDFIFLKWPFKKFVIGKIDAYKSFSNIVFTIEKFIKMSLKDKINQKLISFLDEEKKRSVNKLRVEIVT